VPSCFLSPVRSPGVNMLRIGVLACVVILGLSAVSSKAQDKKKHMVVRAGTSSQQVNNHPWSYSSPGQSSTNCSTNGNVNATGTTIGNTTDVNGTVNANTNCNSTYTPPKTTTGNRVTVDNAAWVTDVNSGDQYLIQCSANWAASKCSQLTGGEYHAAQEGNTMWITGNKGMKEVTAKYHILRYIPSDGSSTVGSTNRGAVLLTEDERFASNWYNELPVEDKEYVNKFCPANPKDKARLPRAKIDAGQPAERAFYCEPWISAKAKQ